MRIRSNIGGLSRRVLDKLEILRDREYLLRPVAFDAMALMRRRIHIDGKASDGNAIGQYSSAYLRERMKDYKRSGDKKIIVSLTRQLENDWSVIATPSGYGIGFLNVFNLNKARWVEQGQKKKIFNLADKEKEYSINKLQELTRDAVNR